jgi:hypothetical protein
MSHLPRCLALCLVLWCPVVAAEQSAKPDAPATPSAARPGIRAAVRPPLPATPPARPVTPPANPETPPPTPGPPSTEPAAPQKAAPTFVQLDADRFKIGDIELNRQTRAIRFPAAINMREGLLEFVIVHDKGKVHESLLRTAINATHLNLSLKLLRYQSSPELFMLRDEEGFPNGLMPAVDAKTKAAARVEIRMLWKDGETERSASVNECINNNRNNTVMPVGPWVYGGSAVYNGRYVAEVTGDIVAILTNQAAIFNYPGDNNRDGEDYGSWYALTKMVPDVGTAVIVEIRPWSPAAGPASKPTPKPAPKAE